MDRKLPFTLDQAKAWKASYGTPFYVYDEEGIRKAVTGVQKAFSWNAGFTECFAVKATPTPAIIRLLASLGCGTDCASVSEVVISRASGLSGRRIMFTSNQTSGEAYRAAVVAGAVINLDDITQIDVLEKAAGIPDTVCLRFNPGSFDVSGSAAVTSPIMGNLSDSKFGMTREQLFEAYSILKQKGVKHFGIHCMAASCCLEASYYPSLAELLFNIVAEVREKLGIVIEIVDLGGGIGIPYRPGQEPVDILAVGQGVREKYEQILVPAGIDVAIYTELGRYITGPNGYLVCSVRGFKHIYREYIGLDATACDLMRPAMYGAYHHITVLGKEDKPVADAFDVCGGLCENNDKFAVERFLPQVEMGDMLVIHDAGAHGRSMGYNYNGMLRCGELLLSADGSVRMIRRPESLDDLFATFDVDGDFNW
ncbi:MAG: diaminopimelate decarboxylase [Spirochaetales bacterium]|nr:diaminopimelate decarboxylase [Spirochaetales bacterium]